MPLDINGTLPHQRHPLVAPQVTDSALALNQTVEEGLVQLETAYKEQADYVSIVQKLQGQLEDLVQQMAGITFWDHGRVSLEALATEVELYDWYRYGCQGVEGREGDRPMCSCTDHN